MCPTISRNRKHGSARPRTDSLPTTRHTTLNYGQ
jgi:hypothetical protein